jgi:hypothetical protein
VGFEPTVTSRPQRFSRAPQSTTLAPLRIRLQVASCKLLFALAEAAEKCLEHFGRFHFQNPADHFDPVVEAWFGEYI